MEIRESLRWRVSDNPQGSRAGSTIHSLPADYELTVDGKLAATYLRITANSARQCYVLCDLEGGVRMTERMARIDEKIESPMDRDAPLRFRHAVMEWRLYVP